MADNQLPEEEKAPELTGFELPPAPAAEPADFELPPAPAVEPVVEDLAAETPDFELPPPAAAPAAEATDLELPAEPAPEAATPVARSADEATSDDKLWALLAYVLSPLAPIVIMLMEDKKNRPYLKLHNMQALVAGAAIVVISLILGVIPLINCIAPLLALGLWVLMIYYGVQAYNGKPVTIPVITDFVKKQGWA